MWWSDRVLFMLPLRPPFLRSRNYFGWKVCPIPATGASFPSKNVPSLCRFLGFCCCSCFWKFCSTKTLRSHIEVHYFISSLHWSQVIYFAKTGKNTLLNLQLTWSTVAPLVPQSVSWNPKWTQLCQLLKHWHLPIGRYFVKLLSIKFLHETCSGG